MAEPSCRLYLIHELQVRKEGDILGPFHSAEQQTGRQLTNVLDAHQVVGLHALGAVSGRGVRLCPKQQGDEAGEVRLSVVWVVAVCQVLSGTGLGAGHASSLDSCRAKRKLE